MCHSFLKISLWFFDVEYCLLISGTEDLRLISAGYVEKLHVLFTMICLFICEIKKFQKKVKDHYIPLLSCWDFKWLLKKRIKCSRYRPGVVQRVGRGIAVLFHDRGTKRGWVVSSTPRPQFTPEKDQVPILQKAGWAPGSVWTSGKPCPHLESILDLPARSQSLYRLSYRAP